MLDNDDIAKFLLESAYSNTVSISHRQDRAENISERNFCGLVVAAEVRNG